LSSDFAVLVGRNHRLALVNTESLQYIDCCAVVCNQTCRKPSKTYQYERSDYVVYKLILVKHAHGNVVDYTRRNNFPRVCKKM
jgi:hypothetical protein